jgi:molybdopterin synthase sulfur carrier subunit
MRVFEPRARSTGAALATGMRAGYRPVEEVVRLTAIRVLYFAGLREAIGLAEEWVEVPPGARTVGALAECIAARHGAYAERRSHVRIARNEAFASNDEVLGDGDVVALIPPVAGG